MEYYGYRLIVIDTLSRAINGDQNDVSEMTEWLSPIQEIAHKNGGVVMLVDHHRKSTPMIPDAVADILGSTGKGAIADTLWGLYRERGKADAKLSVTGREIAETTLNLFFDSKIGCWKFQGESRGLEKTKNHQEILEVIEELGPMNGKEIAEAVGADIGNTYRKLQDMAHGGWIKKESRGRERIYSIKAEVQTLQT